MNKKKSRLKIYVAIWAIIAVWLSYEYLCLNKIRCTPFPYLLKASPEPGAKLSFFLGWLGFAFIVLTNAYIVRKHTTFLHALGKLPGWLDFHIFCGLLGPILIIFHCNFRVGGLVAISFWSMIISFASGLVGRYLYTQLLVARGETKRELKFYEDNFKKCQSLIRPPLTDDMMRHYMNAAIRLAGGTPAVMSGQADPFQALAVSLWGDIRLRLYLPAVPPGAPRNLRFYLRRYGVLRRKVATSGYFQRLMGYWHTFHAPFAFFMYFVSIIHIISALVFRVE